MPDDFYAAADDVTRTEKKRREASLRRYFLRRMKAVKAIVYKLPAAAIGRNGVPDDLVLAPHAQTILVELKQEGEPLDKHQLREHRRLHKRGHVTRVIDTKRKVDLLERDICYRALCAAAFPYRGNE